MEYGALAIFFLLSIGYFAAWYWTRKHKNGFEESRVELTTGQLTGETVERNATAHRFSDEKHKRTVVTYTYYVNNEKYECECVILDRFQAMPASTRVVYQRKRPEYAYLPEFEEPDPKGMSTYHLCSAIFFLLAAVLVLCFTM